MDWTRQRLREYIGSRIEETSRLEYKAAGALDRSDNARTMLRLIQG
jgi:hypothetical protein